MAPSMCEFISRCALFNGRSVAPDVAMRYREHYCMGERSACARWALAVAIGIDEVPDALMPNQHDAADSYLIKAV